MSDPLLPPPWQAEPPKARGAVQWFFTVAGAILLIVTLSVGGAVLLFAGCVSSLAGDFTFLFLVVAAVIALIFVGGVFLWLGLRKR